MILALDKMSKNIRRIEISKNHIFSIALVVVTYVVIRLLIVKGGVEPIVLLLAVFILDQFMSPKESIDRLIVIVAIILGFLPLLGWIHGADSVGPLEIVASIWFASGIRKVVNRKIFVPNSSSVPAITAAAFVFLWWKKISEGTPTEVLARLLPHWDNSSHFLFFYSNLLDRQYILQANKFSGALKPIGGEYPTGIHYVWSLFASSHRWEFAYSSPKAVPFYATSVNLTLALAVGVAVLAIARLGRTNLQSLIFGIIGCGMSIGLLGIGPLSQTVSAGFANMSSVVIGVVIVLSVGMRPIQNKWLNLIVLIGGTFTVLYNWFPLILLLAPILLVAIIRIFKLERWFVSLGITAISVVGGVLPILQTSSLGVSHLATPGGITSFPKTLGVVILLSAFSFGIYLIGKNQIQAAATFMIPACFIFFLGLYLRTTTDDYPYYFQKAFLITCGTTGIFLVMGFATFVAANSSTTDKLIRKMSASLILSAIVASIALVNIAGYVGIDQTKFAPEALPSGVVARKALSSEPWIYTPTIEILLKTVEQVKGRSLIEKSCYTLFVPDRLGVNGKGEQLGWKDLLVNVWFHGLTKSYTTQAYQNSYAVPVVTAALSEELKLAGEIDSKFPKETVCPVSSKIVTSQLQSMSSNWRTLSLESS